MILTDAKLCHALLSCHLQIPARAQPSCTLLQSPVCKAKFSTLNGLQRHFDHCFSVFGTISEVGRPARSTHVAPHSATPAVAVQTQATCNTEKPYGISERRPIRALGSLRGLTVRGLRSDATLGLYARAMSCSDLLLTRATTCKVGSSSIRPPRKFQTPGRSRNATSQH